MPSNDGSGGGGVVGPGGTSGGSDPFGSGPGGGSGTTDPLGSSPTSANASSNLASILPNIQAWFDEWIAKQANSLNQVLNTLWYGTIAVAGISCMAWGLYLLAKDVVAKGDAGVGDLVQGSAAVGGVGGKVAAVATDGASVVAGKAASAFANRGLPGRHAAGAGGRHHK